jgi:uridine phosphorylase
MAVIEPRRGRGEKEIPSRGVLLVNPTEAKLTLDREIGAGARRQKIFNSGLCVDESRRLFFAGPALGAPVAVMTLEKLIALGAKEIILCGWCGAVDASVAVGDVIVPDRAMVGEGTSQYYGCTSESRPSSDFSVRLASFLQNAGLPVQRGCVWSTDGVYREERESLLALNRESGVTAVDMEFSALCSAAAFRGVEFSAALTVSDVTTKEKWQPGQGTTAFRENSRQVLQLLCSGNVFQEK